MSLPEIVGYIVLILAVGVVAICAFAGMSRINDAMDENVGSETGAERKPEMKPWEGWK